MVLERGRRGTITLSGADYLVARNDQGIPLRESSREPAEPEDTVVKRWVVPFGSAGMGSSIQAVPGQFDYGIDVETETWDELAPGLFQGKVGLALDHPVVALAAVTPPTLTAGPSAAGTFTNDTAAGTVAWTNPTNAGASDNAYAVATFAGAGTSNYLKGVNLGFSVPTAATVLGVYVEIEVSATVANAATLNCYLVKGGTIETATVRSLAIANTGTDLTLTTGGPEDLWGNTLAPADVNGATFGIAVSAVATAAVTVNIDRVRLAVVYGQPNRILYIGAGTGVTRRTFSISGTTPAFGAINSVLTPRTFTHGDTGGPQVTDIVVLKEGDAPGDHRILIAYGYTAGIQQINTVNGLGDDTYQLATGAKASSPAYAGKFAKAMGSNNTKSLVFKSTGFSGQSGGAFSRLQSAEITAGTLDLTTSTNWTPATPYQVGAANTEITDLAEYGRGLVAGKTDAAFAFDQNVSALSVYAMAAFAHEDNGVLLPFETDLVILNAQDAVAIPATTNAAIGLSTLVSNLSPYQGYPTAAAGWGQYLYLAYYDGTDSYLVRLRRPRAEGVPHPFVIYPVTKVTGVKVEAMLVASDADGNVFLFYSCPSDTAGKYDVGYSVLGPSSKRRYATGGTWFSSRVGNPAKKKVLERLILYGVGCDANNHWQLAVAWDEGSFNNVGAAVNANGRQVRELTAGSNDTGYVFQVRATCTRSALTDRPRLRGLSVGEVGAGGVIVEGQEQGVAVDRLRYTLNLGQEQETGRGGRFTGGAQSRYDTIKALQGTHVTLIDEDYSGDTTARTVRVESVRMATGKQEGTREGERRAVLTVRLALQESE